MFRFFSVLFYVLIINDEKLLKLEKFLNNISEIFGITRKKRNQLCKNI